MKDVATTSILRAVNASKYVCGRSFALDPLGSLQRSADPSLIWGRREGRRKEGREGTGEGRGGRDGRGGERSDPKLKNPGAAQGSFLSKLEISTNTPSLLESGER